MTNIQDIPHEILLMIFKKLNRHNMLSCQRVCRAWYHPAHLWFLQKVLLYNEKIERFITCIDQNPNAAYLGAVLHIIIMDVVAIAFPDKVKSSPVRLDKEEIKKLFFRFPNLTEVDVYDHLTLFEEFDNEMCTELLKKCPKLDKFEVMNDDNQDKAMYRDTVFKLRQLLTAFDLHKIEFSTQLEGMQFITNFPRLQTIPETRSIQELVPIIERLSNIKAVSLDSTKADQEVFLKQYGT